MRRITIFLSIVILLLAVIVINNKSSSLENGEMVIGNDQPNDLLEVKLEGIWDHNNYYLVSFDLMTSTYKVDQYNSELNFVKSDIGNSWIDVKESLPLTFSYWDSKESKLITSSGEESFDHINCDKLLKISEEGPYVFSSKDTNNLVVCNNPNDSTTYSLYDYSGIVDLKQVQDTIVCIKTLGEGNRNTLTFWDVSSSKVVEVVQGNYSVMHIGSYVILKPNVFSGALENEVYIYDFSQEILTQLLDTMVDLRNIRFSGNGKYMVGYKENRLELYETESWSVKGTVELSYMFDLYENEAIMTVSNDGSKILTFDHGNNQVIIHTLT